MHNLSVNSLQGQLSVNLFRDGKNDLIPVDSAGGNNGQFACTRQFVQGKNWNMNYN